MEYVQFGRTGVRVSRLCLGCMMFGGATDENDSVRIIDRALDSGVNFLDTANIYNEGRSEEVTGKALSRDGKRAKVFLATKVYNRMGDGPNDWGASRRHIFEQVDASLKRLGTDWIDLYQIHRPDPTTPIDETLRALDDLVRLGKIRYAGCSTYQPWRLMQALWQSDKLMITRYDSEQPPYSIMERRVEYGILPVALDYNIAIIPWSPLFGGWLTGKYRRGQRPPEGSREARGARFDETDTRTKARLDAVEKLIPIADDKGVPISQFALAWVLGHPAVTSPIIGPRTEEQLADNIEALSVKVNKDDRLRVDEIIPPGTSVDGGTWIDY